MKKNIFLVMAAMTLVIAMAAGAYAVTVTQGVNATATVVATCEFTAGGPLAFGNVDDGTSAQGPIDTANDGGLLLTCTLNSGPYDLYHDGANDVALHGQKRLTDGTNYINYELRDGAAALANPLSVTGNGATDILSFIARIPTNAVNETPAGAYSDTITFTIAY